MPATSMCLNAGAMGRIDAESETLIPVNRCAFDDAPIAFTSKDNGRDASSNLSPTLRSMGHAASHPNGGVQVAIAMPCHDIAPTLTSTYAKQPDNSDTSQGPNLLAVAYDLRGREGGAQFEGPHDTAAMRAASGGSSRSYLAIGAASETRWEVRRLTVTECERLQGYPDNWTLIEFGSSRKVEPDMAAYLHSKGAVIATDAAGNLRTKAAADAPRYKALGNAWAVNCVRPIALNIYRALGVK